MLDKRAEEQRNQCKHYAAERKRRRSGIHAATTPPCNAPKWTVDKEWRKGNPFVLVKIKNEIYFHCTDQEADCEQSLLEEMPLHDHDFDTDHEVD